MTTASGVTITPAIVVPPGEPAGGPPRSVFDCSLIRPPSRLIVEYGRRDMDVDAFVALHQGGWDRLDELSKRARKPRNLQPSELDELISLYQRTSAHLAHARAAYPTDQALLSRLTIGVAQANGTIYSRRGGDAGRALRQFFVSGFPGAVWRMRRFVIVASALTLLPWAIFTVWLALSPDAFEATGDEAARAAYIEEDFESYYSSEPASAFASSVFTNNVRVAALAFASGILLCVFTAALLMYNGANVGMAGGLFTHVGQWERFWGLILPHGLLEISCVIVAGAAGLSIGWSIISPGDRTRTSALAQEAGHAGQVLLGLVLGLGVAGLIEGFVTGQQWSTALRISIGVIAFVAFWGWIALFGPAAHRAQIRTDAADHIGGSTQRRPRALSSR
jgi:uncharacterized membrane protein SpoIIM required for sporulation